ncbi:hypothetical protein BHM03_00011234 [Ensete ventricosum]|nr:hypothetical protein BHM03_00011234 [Ensete ventricosum]
MKGKSVVSNGGKAVGILLRALLEETIAALFLSGNRGRDFAEEESTNSYDFAENDLTKWIKQALRGDLYDLLELPKEQAVAMVSRPRSMAAMQWVCQQLHSPQPM